MAGWLDDAGLVLVLVGACGVGYFTTSKTVPSFLHDRGWSEDTVSRLEERFSRHSVLVLKLGLALLLAGIVLMFVGR